MSNVKDWDNIRHMIDAEMDEARARAQSDPVAITPYGVIVDEQGRPAFFRQPSAADATLEDDNGPICIGCSKPISAPRNGVLMCVACAEMPAPAPDDLRELREAAERATPGPWRQGDLLDFNVYKDDGLVCETGFAKGKDAAFIALANPSTVLSLIARIARLEVENARLRKIEAVFEDSLKALGDMATDFQRQSDDAADEEGRLVFARFAEMFGNIHNAFCAARAAVSEPKP